MKLERVRKQQSSSVIEILIKFLNRERLSESMHSGIRVVEEGFNAGISELKFYARRLHKITEMKMKEHY